jgi:EmrB/QacA subfamily drug resistance transporter
MTTPTTSDAATSSRRAIIASVAVLLFLGALDQTIVATALPTIVSELGGLDQISWVVTAYILASTVVAPLYGKMGDLYGRRPMILICVLIFLLGSILCGAAASMPALIIARAVQGLGGGGIFVLALSVIGDTVEPKDRGKIQGVFSGVFGLSSVLGPLLGGWFVDSISWRWIFYINIPIGIVALAAFMISFKPLRRKVRSSIDYAGAMTLTLTLSSLVLLTTLGGKDVAWSSPQAFGFMALCLASGAAFIFVEMRAAEPILPLSLFRINTFVTSSALAFFGGAILIGSVTFLPLYLQMAKGASAMSSGLQLIPLTLGIAGFAMISGRYMSKTGHYRILPMFGMVCTATGLAFLSRISPDMPDLLFWIAITLVGIGLGGTFPVTMTAVQAASPRSQIGAATASVIMFRQIGGSLSVALFGAIFTARVAASVDAALAGEKIDGLTSIAELGPSLLATLPQPLQVQIGLAVSHALRPGFLITMGCAALAFIIAWRMHEISLERPDAK